MSSLNDPEGQDTTSEPGAAPFVPVSRRLGDLDAAARDCRGCELVEGPLPALLGSGASPSPFMMVGEQPDPQEVDAGTAFVDPAGLLLRRALADAGIDPERTYYTNAVKHTRFAGPSRRRQARPTLEQAAHCFPWLRAELETVRPLVVVLLGAVAARAVFGPDFQVRGSRGECLDAPGHLRLPRAPRFVVTRRPSSVLRSRQRAADYRALVDDLRVAATCLPVPPAMPVRRR